MPQMKDLMLEAAGLLHEGTSCSDAETQLRISHPELSAEDAAVAVDMAAELNAAPATRRVRRRKHLRSSLKWFGGSAAAYLWVAFVAPAIFGPDADQSIWYLAAGGAALVGVIELLQAVFLRAPRPADRPARKPHKSTSYDMEAGSWFLMALLGLAAIGFTGLIVLMASDTGTFDAPLLWAGLFGLLALAGAWAVRPRRRRFELAGQLLIVPRSALEDKSAHRQKLVRIPVDRVTGMERRRGEQSTRLVVTFRDNGRENLMEACHYDGNRDGAGFVSLCDVLERCLPVEDGQRGMPGKNTDEP